MMYEMRETVTTMELRRRLGEVLDRVALRHDEFIVSRKGKPLAAMVPVATLDRLRRAARLYLLDAAERLEAPAPGDEIDALADEAKHETRPAT